jgi:hypothetical protein
VERVVEALQDNISALDHIDDGDWHEYTGDLVLSEEQWSAIRSARNELREALKALGGGDENDAG